MISSAAARRSFALSLPRPPDAERERGATARARRVPLVLRSTLALIIPTLGAVAAWLRPDVALPLAPVVALSLVCHAALIGPVPHRSRG